MVFIESAVFTRRVKKLLTEDAYAEFRQCLAAHPQLGDVIQGTGGLRKVRWSIKGGGKSGGVRVIYFPAWRRRKFACCSSTAKA